MKNSQSLEGYFWSRPVILKTWPRSPAAAVAATQLQQPETLRQQLGVLFSCWPWELNQKLALTRQELCFRAMCPAHIRRILWPSSNHSVCHLLVII